MDYDLFSGFGTPMPVSPVARERACARSAHHARPDAASSSLSSKNPAEPEQGRLYLTYAEAGSVFQTPMPMHAGFALIQSVKLAVSSTGVATVAYGLLESEEGTWVRQFTPGGPLQFSKEISVPSRATGPRGVDLQVDGFGNAFLITATPNADGGQVVYASILPANGTDRIRIPVDSSTDAPNVPLVQVILRFGEGAQLAWKHQLDGDPVDNDIRTCTIDLAGQLGTLFAYGTKSAASIDTLDMALSPLNVGSLLYGEVNPHNVFRARID